MTAPQPRWRRLVAVSWRPVLALAAAAAVAYALFGLGPLYQSQRLPDDPPAPAAEPPAQQGWIPRPRPVPAAPGCTPRAQRVCMQGDAWWLDSCGNLSELAQECGMATCEVGECVPDDRQCLDDPLRWTCDGDVARGCAAGKVFAIDCAAKDRRCVMTQEGPVCREPHPDDCTEATGTTRCDGSVLVACVEGREQRFDCAQAGARCMPGRGGRQLRCVRVAPAPEDEACGPCGCPPSVEAEEACNGRDDDGDGFVDEGADCATVDVVAFVVTDDGQATYTKDDIEAELQRVNEAFARDDEFGLSFALADVVALDREEWLEIDDEEIQNILANPVLGVKRDAAYVPILFTEVLLFEEVPRPGLATPPNGVCGGQRRIRSPQPGLGGVIIAKRRWGTTVAHEIGHYLGLCHTHMPAVDAVETYEGEGDPEGARACQEPCAWEGDGVCDTPEDPGPEQCAVDATCTIACETEASPEPANIMAYYPMCRTMFTREQALQMRHGLALRRGWHGCLWGEGCPCEPAAAQCPEQMSCRQYVDDGGGATWRCGLDGAVVPGAECDRSEDCSRGSTCVQSATGDSRCVRPCAVGATPACDCREVPGVAYPLCVDDLRSPA